VPEVKVRCAKIAGSFEKYKIIPRMLRDVSARDISIELFGQKLPSPLLLCPIGVLEMAHPLADLAVGNAAASLGIPYIFSNQASKPMEEVAGAMGKSPRWFQLYWSKSNELVKSFVQRADNADVQRFVVTLDTTVLGWRHAILIWLISLSLREKELHNTRLILFFSN